jgi:1-aminocyclopropane-1-carboxylate deaminase/D-cysteine desulfhydrase-like pyridoxal-dependent ACC family enzyme
LLQECQALGLELIPLTRTAFDDLGLQGPTPTIDIPKDAYFIPMGVQNAEGQTAMQGLAEAIAQTDTYDYIALTAGMGTTLRGFLQGMPTTKFIVAAPFKDPTFLLDGLPSQEKERIYLSGSAQNQKFGTLAPEARAVAQDFQAKTGLWVDNLYMPNLLFHLRNLCFNDYFVPRQKLLLLHCGGARHNRL